jgi:hypothetical protein
MHDFVLPVSCYIGELPIPIFFLRGVDLASKIVENTAVSDLYNCTESAESKIVIY